MSSLLGHSQVRVSAVALLSASTGIAPRALAADAPNLTLGAGTGYASHFGRSYEVDVVSGASAPPEMDSRYSDGGVAVNAFADFAAVDLGRGNLGLMADFTIATPKTVMNIALEPRYRLRFPMSNSILRSIEPWMGVGVAFAFRERIDKDFYLWLPIVAGVDVALGSERLYAGVAVQANIINPKGTTRHLNVAGQDHKYESRMNNVVTLARVSYLLF